MADAVNSTIRPVSKHVVTGPEDPAIPPDTESTHIMTVRSILCFVAFVQTFLLSELTSSMPKESPAKESQLQCEHHPYFSWSLGT
jgi:hypothetical protein